MLSDERHSVGEHRIEIIAHNRRDLTHGAKRLVVDLRVGLGETRVEAVEERHEIGHGQLGLGLAHHLELLDGVDALLEVRVAHLCDETAHVLL